VAPAGKGPLSRRHSKEIVGAFARLTDSGILRESFSDSARRTFSLSLDITASRCKKEEERLQWGSYSPRGRGAKLTSLAGERKKIFPA